MSMGDGSKQDILQKESTWPLFERSKHQELMKGERSSKGHHFWSTKLTRGPSKPRPNTSLAAQAARDPWRSRGEACDSTFLWPQPPAPHLSSKASATATASAPLRLMQRNPWARIKNSNRRLT